MRCCNYMQIDELEKLIEDKKKELYTLETINFYPLCISKGRKELSLSLKIDSLIREISILQEALIFRQRELLKGKYFYAIKK